MSSILYIQHDITIVQTFNTHTHIYIYRYTFYFMILDGPWRSIATIFQHQHSSMAQQRPYLDLFAHGTQGALLFLLFDEPSDSRLATHGDGMMECTSNDRWWKIHHQIARCSICIYYHLLGTDSSNFIYRLSMKYCQMDFWMADVEIWSQVQLRQPHPTRK